MTLRTRFLTAGLVGSALTPGVAEAHLVNTGFGPFYDGISHLFVTAPDILVVVALGLLAGLRGPATGRAALTSIIGAWTLGGLVGLMMAPDALWAVATTLTFLAAGAVLALDRELSTPTVAALSIGIGLLHGFLNGAEAATSGIGLVGLAGSLTAIAVMATLITALAVIWSEGWTRIVLRVAGSWIVAIGMLMLGWLFRPGA